MRIAFIGCGNVGAPLADRLQRAGHEVVLAARHAGSATVKAALARNDALQVAPPTDAVAEAEVVFLATPFDAAAGAVNSLEDSLVGKVLVDCTNPVGPGLRHGLGSETSGGEHVQALAPRAHVVKAFNIYGYETFENNHFPAFDVRPTMLLCGNDKGAKQVVSGLVRQLGWDPLDVGGLVQALHLEHMALLWVRMVRVDGHTPHMAWTRLHR